MNINPYLNFNGNAFEAMNFYRSVFGGDFIDVNRFSELPDGEVDPADADKIMHISMPVGDSTLMASDIPSSMDAVTPNGSINLSVAADSLDEARRIFDALAEGGSVVMPFELQFWGDWFGSCVDRFGISWMLNQTPED